MKLLCNVTLNVTPPLVRRIVTCSDSLRNFHMICDRLSFSLLYIRFGSFDLKMMGDTKFPSSN
jgi:hypothetical protein